MLSLIDAESNFIELLINFKHKRVTHTNVLQQRHEPVRKSATCNSCPVATYVLVESFVLNISAPCIALLYFPLRYAPGWQMAVWPRMNRSENRRNLLYL